MFMRRSPGVVVVARSPSTIVCAAEEAGNGRRLALVGARARPAGRGEQFQEEIGMAKADSKKFGAGVKGKGDGTGAMTELDDAAVRKDDILSNRDKKQASTDERGLDSRNVQTEEFKDHAGNRRQEE
jgi:hypothetical protein